MSDLLFVNCHPYLGSGDPQGLLHMLDQVAGLDAKIFVPGHGPVGTAADLDLMRQYIHTSMDLTQSFIDAGKEEQALDEIEIPDPFGDFEISSFFYDNLHFLYRRASKS